MTFRKVIEKYGYPFISKDVSNAVHDVTTQAELHNLDKRETGMYATRFTPTGRKGKKYPSFVLERWDYLLDAPFKISHFCCNEMKKKPAKRYEKESGRKPFLGQLAEESRIRETVWIKNGCNAFQTKRQVSNPMSFWTEQDVLHYIKENNLAICSVYGDIVRDEEVNGQMTMADIGIGEDTSKLKTTRLSRTGCMFCGFGCHLEKCEKGRFELMKETHPKQYEYIMKPWSEGGLGYKEVIDWLNEHGNLHIRY